MKKIISNLTTWVVLALIAGVALGYFAPETAIKMEPLGTHFINVVKLFINPIIFLTISLGIVGMGSLKQVGRLGVKTLLYFEIITIITLLIGVFVIWIIQPGKDVSIIHVNTEELIQYTQKTEEFSMLNFLKKNITMQVLIISIFFGIFLSKYKHSGQIIKWLNIATKYIFRGLHWIMLLSPIGAFGGIAYTIGKFGIGTLLPITKLLVSVYITMTLFLFIVLGSLLSYYKISISKYLSYIKEELLIVLGTSSSESALPSLMEKLQKMGCSKSVVGLVVPAGYSFNLDGITIYLSMTVLFLAQVYNVDLSWTQVGTIIGILMIASKGVAGVTGSSFVILASTLSVVKVIPIEGLALLLGVDRFMNEARSITNFIGNGVATIFIANSENQFDRDIMDKAFDKDIYYYDSIKLKKINTTNTI